ncbi:hypothetical protein FB645_005682 [Coemansia sp. IMI 203386]|nr:hypothetical protein FB645_005682 [Coemansia sp. IMI 203386]
MDSTYSSASASASSSTKTTAPSWNTIQERLRDSIVAIECTGAFDFDTRLAGSSNATGFIVDVERGIVMSNRHVMGPGPSYHKGIFFNNVEVFLQPCYYDPIHDFSLFRYDPADLKEFKPKAIPLCPEKAFSGMEFRVASNNLNEKMSVHSGELSQLDRNVPDYEDGYNDYNTFYIQSSTTCDGGSSGSPVVNIKGEAVALMAGGADNASSNFFYPLYRAVYALDYIKRNEVPPRGTLQAIFTHESHFEAERHALNRDLAIEQGLDVDNTTGVLMVQKIIPMGPADGKLKVGDIVIAINKTPIPGFIEMSDIVDGSVGKKISIRVFRNKKLFDIEILVQDAYAITPSKILCLANCWLHDMSFQLAARRAVPISGVYISGTYNSFLGNHNLDKYRVIYSLNGIPTPNLEALMDAFMDIPRGKDTVFRLRSIKNVRDEKVIIARCPLATLKDKLYTRSSITGFWSYKPYTGLPINDAQSFDAAVLQCMVTITTQSLCNADGCFTKHGSSNGLVVDKDKGIILCSRNLVNNPTCEIVVDFGNMISVPATLAYTHPLYPVAFLKYNPEILAQRAGKYKMSSLNLKNIVARDMLKIGSSVSAISIDKNGNLTFFESSVSARFISQPKDCTCCVGARYYNIDQFTLAKCDFGSENGLGIVCNSRGSVRGLWLNIPYCLDTSTDEKGSYIGIDISAISRPLAMLTAKIPQEINTIGILDVQFDSITLKQAKFFGVDTKYIDEIRQSSPTSSQNVFVVSKILQKRGRDKPSLQIGDVIIKLNGKREPTPSVQERSATIPSQVFVFSELYGSPVFRKTDCYNYYITEIDHTPVKTLDDVLKVVQGLASSEIKSFNTDVASNKQFSSGKLPGCDVKVRAVTMYDQEIVLSLRTNDHYFPAWQAIRGPATEDTWKVNEL